MTMAAVLLAVAHLPIAAQSESGLLLEAGAEKKISKQFSVGAEGDFRTRNDFKTVDRWSVGLSADYKFNKWLKASAGYTLLNNNFREDIRYKSSGALNNWRPSYWGVRHRLNASLTAIYKPQKNLRLSLRERWQYTWRPEKTVSRWDFDDEQWEDKVRRGKAKSQLRSRVQVAYDRKKTLLTPFANVELYNAWGIEKVRYSLGTDIRIDKHNELTVFYRYQDMRHVDADDYDPDMHYLGIGYKWKL